MKSRRYQGGLVLVLGLVFLAIASIVAIFGMRASSLQEKITSSQRSKTISLMAAEYGASQIARVISEGGVLPLAGVNYLISGLGAGGASWRYVGSGNVYTVTGLVLNGSYELSRSVIAVEFAGSGGRFSYSGLLADKSITVNGFSSMNGGAHSNANFSVEGKGGLNSISAPYEVSANGRVFFEGKNVDDKFAVSGKDIFDLKAVVGKVSENPKYVSVFTSANFVPCVSLPKNLAGGTFYCNGGVDLSNYSNGTIYVKGDVYSSEGLSNVSVIVQGNFTHTGAGNFGSDMDTQVRIATTGNIVMSGSGKFRIYGTLWSDGDLVRNGGGEVSFTGNAVTFGSQTWNGNLVYSEAESKNPGDDGPGVRIKSWKEMAV